MTAWKKPSEVTLLTGGNPQIPKGDGNEPVQAYIEAMPDWKRPVGELIDGLIVAAVPGVHKKVRWNQPFYGADEDTSFVSFRCYTKYVQIGFLNGTSLDPQPPKTAKDPNVAYLDIHEDDDIDEALLTSWFEQGSVLPGSKL